MTDIDPDDPTEAREGQPDEDMHRTPVNVPAMKEKQSESDQKDEEDDGDNGDDGN